MNADTAVRRHLEVRVSAAARGQSGYVLGIVLAAMTVGLLLITALMSLAFATHRAARVQQQLATEQRAVDGALDTAVTRLRAAYDSPSQGDLCAPIGAGSQVDRIDFDGANQNPADDVEVTVRCGDSWGDASSAEGTTQLVGDDYAEVPGGTDWTGWNWASALGSVDPPPASLSPSLIHEGSEPLKFNGSVVARSGAAALLDGPSDSGAVEVRGNYIQGSAGYPGTGTQCGMLDPGSTLVPGGDLSRTAIIDDGGIPACGESGAAMMPPTPVEEGSNSNPVVAALGSCAEADPDGDGLVELPSGDYNAARVAELNALFDGSCSKTYHFEPGDYWFDAAGPDNVLRFDDVGSDFVFGTRDADTCDPGAVDGVKVVLSGRTTIDHRGGNVSICAPEGQGDALVQSSIVESTITPQNPRSLTHATNTGRWCGFLQWCWDRVDDFTPVSDVISQDGMAKAMTTCNPTVTAACVLGFEVDVTADGTRPMDSVEVAWTGSELPPLHGSNRTVAVRIEGATGVICDIANVPIGRSRGFTTAVDLTSCLGGRPESDLDGTTMTIKFTYPNYVGGETLELYLRGLEFRVNARAVAATAAASAPGTVSGEPLAWTNAEGVLADGGGTAEHPEPGPCNAVLPGICENRNTPGAIEAQALTVSKFDPSSAGFDDDDVISTLRLGVKNSGGDNQIAAPAKSNPVGNRGETRVKLSWPVGNSTESCDAPWQNTNTYTRSTQPYFIDIIGQEDSSCWKLRGQPMKLLEDLDVTFSIKPELGLNFGTNLGVELPKLDHLWLSASSDSVTESRRAKITNDVAANTRFRVYGDVTMPRVSLDIAWTGTRDGDPIVYGSLQLHSLGSTTGGADAEVGTVCCGPASRVVTLEAEIPDADGDPVQRGVARVVPVSPAEPAASPPKPLATVKIIGWQLCGSGGCGFPAGGGTVPAPDP